MLRLESSCCGWESASKECFGHMSEVKRGSWFSGILLVLKSVARCTCIFFFFKLLHPHGNLFTYCFIEFSPSACGFTKISCWVWVAPQRQLRVQWTLTVPHAHSLSCYVMFCTQLIRNGWLRIIWQKTTRLCSISFFVCQTLTLSASSFTNIYLCKKQGDR